MPCYRPLPAQKKIDGTIKVYPRKASVVYNPDGFFVPCGQCIGCRLERSRQWAIRCVHESQLHEDNSFITLTYSPENLPQDHSLHVDHFQKFMKKLRKTYNQKIRFFHCGEYGEKFSRPHYHACLFGLDFKDKKHWKTVNGNKLYTSETLNKIWGHGYAVIGDVTFESAAYVARYITKKITGKDALTHYTEFDKTTGEIYAERKPEYVTMSRRPGIGKHWFDKYHKNTFDNDRVIMRGKELKPPKYYDNQYELLFPEEMEKIKQTRQLQSKNNLEDKTDERLKIKETIKLLKNTLLKRGYENGNT